MTKLVMFDLFKVRSVTNIVRQQSFYLLLPGIHSKMTNSKLVSLCIAYAMIKCNN